MRTLPAPDLQRKQKCVRVAGPGWLLGAMLLAVIAQLAAHGQGVPTISSIAPSSATAGGPGFTLTVNGTGFFAGSVVQVNGAGGHYLSERDATYRVDSGLGHCDTGD